MDIRGYLSLWLNGTTSQLLGLCLLLAALCVRTGYTAGTPSYTSSVGQPDATTICDCPMSSSFLTCQTSAEECESEEVREGDSCYRFVTETRKTHQKSLLDCIERNSHLVYIESRQEQNFIVGHASSLSRIDYWIGLVAARAAYVWSDGSLKLPDLFTVVDSGGAGDCVHMVRSFRDLLFYTSSCNQLRTFLCESDITPTGCPNHWHPFGDSCYELVLLRRSHDAARRYCEVRGGHLVYIDTAEELDDVINQLPNSDLYWIGLTAVRYDWMDGSPALFQTFESANGDDGNECFRMRPSSLNWNDRGCNNLFGYICERRISTAPSPRIVDQSVECPSSTPSDLMFLSQSGAMCIDDEDGTTPVLRSCDTWRGIEGCGCGQTNDDLVSCSVGSCKMTFSDTDNKWPSKFNCSCSSDNGNTFNLTADQGTIGCLVQLAPPTTPMSTTSLTTTSLSTTSSSTTTQSTTTQLSTSTVVPTTVEVTSNRMMAETTVVTDVITTETLTQSQRATVSVDTSTESSKTTPQIPAQSTESTGQGDFESTANVEATTVRGSYSGAASTSVVITTTTGPSTSQDGLTAESGAASGRRGDDGSIGLTVGVTVAAVSVVGVVVGSLVWKKLGGTLALKASKGSLGSSLSPSSQFAGSPNAGVNPMYGLSDDTLIAGSDVLAGVTEGGMHGVRNPTYEGWKGDTDILEV